MSQNGETPPRPKIPSFGKTIGMFLGIAVLGFLYVVILPIAELGIVVGLSLKCPAFVCTPLRWGIEALPGNAVSWLTITFVCLFMASVAWRNPLNPALRFLSKTHRYASLLAIASFGTEGFAWPVPYLLLVLLAGSQANHTERLLRGAIEPFLLTWLVVGLAVASCELVLWLQRSNSKQEES